MAAGSVVSFVFNKIGTLLIEEASLLVGVKDEVEWLRDQLGWMNSFLKDAYTKRRRGDERVKRWERAVRDTAYRVEDIIDSYMSEIITRRQQPLKCCGILKPVERYARELKHRHKLGDDIKQLKAQIHQISENRIAYGLVDLGQSAPPESTTYTDIQRRRRIFPTYGDSVVVGFQDHKRKILKELLDTTLTQRCVKSIVGMGGLGKTTLAKMVYNTDEITKSFSSRAWVSVSQDYTLIQLLKDIAKQVTGHVSEGLDESAVQERIYQRLIYRRLQGKRYFIVLDDIWTTGVWHLIKEALPNDGNSSRVLLTTRFIDVAKYVDSSIDPYQLPYLNEKESWELFLQSAFPTTHDTMPECPRGLEHIARKLVNKCGGLPLAILVLGGLMSTKKLTPMAWMKVEEGIGWASTEDGQQCLEILALSYDDFPNPNLRSCFLYMGVFPEDSVIEASQLINLWVAEGFIPQLPNHTMEDTAEDYLEQLVQRSMIEVVERDWNGSIGACRIHDLLRELCLREAKEDGFLDVCRSSTDLGRMGLEHNPVRLAFHYLEKVEGCCPSSDLRSLSIYNASEVSREIFQEWTKKLRVMHLKDFKNSGLMSILVKIKAANHLRYFGFSPLLYDSSALKELPPSFGDISMKVCSYSALNELPPSFGDIFTNLQTLDLRRVHIMQLQLPESLGKMKTLRHLYTPMYCKLPPNIANLTNLQTLDVVDARGGWIEQSLAMMSNIRTLSICKLQDAQQNDFAIALRKLEHLSSLRIEESSTISAEYIRALSNHNRLFNLILEGAMPQGQLPESHEFPQNLTVFQLYETKLEKDPMPTLEQLPNLVSLVLNVDSYIGKEMTCTAGGFLRLEKLELELSQLERWEVEDGAMPNLIQLRTCKCEKLIRLPEGLPNLKKLHKVQLFDMSEDFKSRLQEGVGEDWWKIEHVKSIEYNMPHFVVQ